MHSLRAGSSTAHWEQERGHQLSVPAIDENPAMKVRLVARTARLFRWEGSTRTWTRVGSFPIGRIPSPARLAADFGLQEDEVADALKAYRQAMVRRQIAEQKEILARGSTMLLDLAQAISQTGNEATVEELRPSFDLVRKAMARAKRRRALDEDLPVVLVSDQTETVGLGPKDAHLADLSDI